TGTPGCAVASADAPGSRPVSGLSRSTWSAGSATTGGGGSPVSGTSPGPGRDDMPVTEPPDCSGPGRDSACSCPADGPAPVADLSPQAASMRAPARAQAVRIGLGVARMRGDLDGWDGTR